MRGHTSHVGWRVPALSYVAYQWCFYEPIGESITCCSRPAPLGGVCQTGAIKVISKREDFCKIFVSPRVSRPPGGCALPSPRRLSLGEHPLEHLTRGLYTIIARIHLATI